MSYQDPAHIFLNTEEEKKRADEKEKTEEKFKKLFAVTPKESGIFGKAAIVSIVVLIFCFSFSTMAFAQATPPTDALPGCTLAWVAPLVEDIPDNPGTQISQWVHAGDHKGFVFNTRKDDLHDWDKLKEQKIEDPSLLKVDCPMIGVEDLGTYSVGVKAEDFSLNASPAAWITFNIIAPDTEALAPIAELCMNGSLNGNPVQTCQRPGN